jgi:uncharacterized protein (TIGR02594 family)
VILPAQYQWLAKLPVLPKTISVALAEFGTKEIVGKGNSRTIIGWRDELNQAGAKISGYSDDDIPWCGLFAAIVVLRRKSNASEVVDGPLWALNWIGYGAKSPEASLGDVLVFKRPSGGHVGFYVAEDATAYHVLGGNQSNKVCITRIAKYRCVAVRRPPYVTVPETVKPYRVASAGSLSQNEA